MQNQPAAPTPVTEDLVFAVVNRTGMPFGVVSNVLFAAHAHHKEAAAAAAVAEAEAAAAAAALRLTVAV